MKVAVTGALSGTGRYIAAKLMARQCEVVNLSRRASPFAQAPLSLDQVAALAPRPLDFEDSVALARALEGCDALLCTHWVRFAAKGAQESAHERAARQCAALFAAAKVAGVRKIVFAAHTRCSAESPFEYIAGKARAVEALRASGVNYAVVRPCGLFGDTAQESILLNNAAWVMRRTPLFLTAGDGSHRFQPVHVRDMADLMVELGCDMIETTGEERDACGPDVPTALELFTRLRDAVRGPAVVAAAPFLSTRAITLLTKPIDLLTGDVLLDKDDLDLLCSGLTVADDPGDPAISSRRSVFEWIDANGADLGKSYVNSVQRYYYN